jgi:tetratricopeptide (TPR) repeat protein
MKTTAPPFFRSFLLTALLIIAIMPVSLGQKMAVTTSSDEALQHYCKGKELMQILKYNQAASEFDKALILDPEFAMAYILRAAISDSPEDYFTYINEGLALTDKMPQSEKNFLCFVKASKERDWDKKMTYLNDLIEFYPGDPWFRELEGMHYQNIEKNYPRALEAYLKAVELNPRSAAWNHLGYLYMDMKDFENAEKSFMKFIEIYPDENAPYDSYAEFLMTRGEHEKSVEMYKKALEKDPGLVGPYKGIGDNYVFLGKYDLARENYRLLFDRTGRMDEKFTAMERKAFTYLYEGDIDMAINTLKEEERLALESGNIFNAVNINYISGYILCEKGRPEEAREYYSEAVRLSDQKDVDTSVKKDMKFWSHFMNCSLALSQKDAAAAANSISACEKIQDRDLTMNELNLKNQFCARMEMLRGNYQQAMNYLLKADQENPMTMYYKSVLYGETGQNEMSDEMKGKISQVKKFNLYTAIAVNLIK